jgi:hypothetical protein
VYWYRGGREAWKAAGLLLVPPRASLGNSDGEKEVLGLWVEQTEGAKFWFKVVNELKKRGLTKPRLF